MKSSFVDWQEKIRKIYDAFNAREVETVLANLTADVKWPNGWEGGYVHGHEEVRNYWQRQWKEINPIVKPVSIVERPDGSLAVLVHQLVKDNGGNVVFDGQLTHVYTTENDLFNRMEIEKNDD